MTWTVRWIGACMLAEAVGVAVAAVTSANTARWASADSVGLAVAAVLLAGCVEGLLLGTLTGRVLWRTYPGFPIGRWMAATTLAVGVAWGLGLVPSTLAGVGPDPGVDPSPWVVLGGGAAMGAVFGPLIGAAQLWALGDHEARPSSWMMRNAVGWALAMPLIMASASWVPGTWTPGAVAGLAFVTGGLAGVFVGGATVGGWSYGADL